MRNSIDYPGEWAPRRPAVIAQAGYTGQNHFSVTYGDQKVTVRAEDGWYTWRIWGRSCWRSLRRGGMRQDESTRIVCRDAKHRESI